MERLWRNSGEILARFSGKSWRDSGENPGDTLDNINIAERLWRNSDEILARFSGNLGEILAN